MEFTCPECSAKVKAPGAIPGHRMFCPKCKQMIFVPSPDTKPAGESSAAAAGPASRPQSQARTKSFDVAPSGAGSPAGPAPSRARPPVEAPRGGAARETAPPSLPAEPTRRPVVPSVEDIVYAFGGEVVRIKSMEAFRKLPWSSYVALANERPIAARVQAAFIGQEPAEIVLFTSRSILVREKGGEASRVRYDKVAETSDPEQAAGAAVTITLDGGGSVDVPTPNTECAKRLARLLTALKDPDKYRTEWRAEAKAGAKAQSTHQAIGCVAAVLLLGTYVIWRGVDPRGCPRWLFFVLVGMIPASIVAAILVAIFQGVWSTVKGEK